MAKLNDLRTLGRSGLPVSPLALGTMTFGNASWGSDEELSGAIFDAYVEAGGNFIDTADVYSGGRSEELVGEFVARRKLRDRVVVATKFSFNGDKGNPLGGGNGRKNMHRALGGSLRRLRMDYVDLYWAHVWDGVTPAEELLQSLGELVRQGKIRYFGLSDAPAWFATEMATMARMHGVPGPIALQMPHSLTERTFEQEHVPAALALGLGMTPWGPLTAGFLTGKYSRDSEGKIDLGGGRYESANQPYRKPVERDWKILDTLREVSAEAGRPMAQVALAWVRMRPGVTSTILGASKVEQLRDNLASLEVELRPEQMARLDDVSGMDATNPYRLFTAGMRRGIFAGAQVEGWR